MLDHINIQAILWGVLYATLATVFLSVRVIRAFIGKAKPDKDDLAGLYSNNKFLISMVGVCSLTSILAGYVAGTKAHDFPIANALATGVLGLVLNFAFWGCAKKMPLWYKITGVVAIIPLTCLGGLLVDFHV